MSDSWKIELESKIAHQEVTIESLHETVYEHQKAIDKLTMALDRIMKHLTSGDGLEIGPGNDKPPHY